jgi:hypothetical protein
MTLLLNQNWRWLVCFLTGLVGAFLLSFGLSFGQAVSAATHGENQSATSVLVSTFDEVAASHLESNFYR